MALIVNTIFFYEIIGVIKTLNFWPPCWCTKVVHQDGRSIHFLLKVSNTRSPITLERNALALQNLVRCIVLNLLQFHKHFGIENCF